MALKRILKDINQLFPAAGLPKPTVMLSKHRLMPPIESAMDRLGIREYSDVVYPVGEREIRVTVKLTPHWRIMENMAFEYESLRYISGKVSEGAKILDIGAGLGTYTLLFSRLAGINGKIVAFEPDPRAREVLTDNVRRNNLTNVRIDDHCVADSDGTVVLRGSRRGIGSSSIIERPLAKVNFRASVQATTVDHYCRQNRLAPSGIKIDVEGAERLVLEGAIETMMTHHPWILMELHGGILQPGESAAIWNRLADNAKKIVILDGERGLCPHEVESDEAPDYSFSHIFAQC